MLALLFILGASILAALANLFLRINLDTKGTAKGYFVAVYACSFLISLAIAYPQLLHIPVSFAMLFAGTLAGFLVTILMNLTTTTLTKGPAGLTFAFQVSGSVFPALIFFLVFGQPFGFTMTPFMVLGLLLVLVGLFWAAKPKNGNYHWEKGWLGYALSIFAINIALITVMQWRCLFFLEKPKHLLIPFHCQANQDMWFMPGMFGTATLLQAIYMVRSGHRPKSSEMVYGLLGGASNGISTFLLLMATTLTTSTEEELLFPLFAIAVTTICNLWSYILYSERINWWANVVCSIGILIASIS